MVSASLLIACSARPLILEKIFDMPPRGQPDPGKAPVVRAPRRTPLVDQSIPTITKEYLALMEERRKEGPPRNWAAVFKSLPKDDEDNIDWMNALASKLIQPRGTIDAGGKDPGETADDDDEDLELNTSGKPNKMVQFSHIKHTKWLTCSNCHPGIFKKKAGSAKITMDAIDDGKYCGVCHDNVALAQPADCDGCHKVKTHGS